MIRRWPNIYWQSQNKIFHDSAMAEYILAKPEQNISWFADEQTLLAKPEQNISWFADEQTLLAKPEQNIS